MYISLTPLLRVLINLRNNPIYHNPSLKCLISCARPKLKELHPVSPPPPSPPLSLSLASKSTAKNRVQLYVATQESGKYYEKAFTSFHQSPQYYAPYSLKCFSTPPNSHTSSIFSSVTHLIRTEPDSLLLYLTFSE